MRTVVDAAGRLVIPHSLLNHIGLAGGGEVEIEVDGEALRIKPVTGNGLREEDGLLIISTAGFVIDDALVRDLIDEDRQRR
jgi:AbrB family looped-hinge helix DNA binding protein